MRDGEQQQKNGTEGHRYNDIGSQNISKAHHNYRKMGMLQQVNVPRLIIMSSLLAALYNGIGLRMA
jgi:hypothetical protein